MTNKCFEYSRLTQEIESVLGAMAFEIHKDENVKSERDNSKRLLKLAQELREICD